MDPHIVPLTTPHNSQDGQGSNLHATMDGLDSILSTSSEQTVQKEFQRTRQNNIPVITTDIAFGDARLC